MKKIKYFGVSENCSAYYHTKKEALQDIKKTWGNEIVHLYTLAKESNIQELTSEDRIGTYQYGKKIGR